MNLKNGDTNVKKTSRMVNWEISAVHTIILACWVVRHDVTERWFTI